ncbi:TPA: hypothetical protein ACGUQA_004593 [Vibrio vulnificus]
MEMSQIYSRLTLQGQVMGIKRSEQYGNSLQFMVQDGESITQVDVKLSDGDNTPYQMGTVVSIPVRAFGRKTGGVGFQATDKGRVSEQK